MLSSKKTKQTIQNGMIYQKQKAKVKNGSKMLGEGRRKEKK
jgi:hypothetical protein